MRRFAIVSDIIGNLNVIGKPVSSKGRILPFVVLLSALLIWTVVSSLHVFPESVFPSPLDVAKGFLEEMRTGRLTDDIVASLFRVTTGFGLAVLFGIPVGS
jgi:NitT/TauT family transport system permease protein